MWFDKEDGREGTVYFNHKTTGKKGVTGLGLVPTLDGERQTHSHSHLHILRIRARI